MLVVDDVTSLNWPKELSLTMEEKLVGGSNTVVFMLRPGSNENCHILNLRFCFNSVSTPSEGAASHELRAVRRLLNKGQFNRKM